MGLQIWLPLNGSFENKGLANTKLTTSGSWSDISKIGSKSFTNGKITMDAETTDSIYNNDEMTFAFWFYANAADGTSTGNCIVGNGSNMAGMNNRKFAIFNWSTINDLHWSWQNDVVEGVSGGTFTGGVKNDCLPSYEWTHVVFTYKNPTATLYINGEKITTSTGVSNSASFKYATSILNLNSYQCVNDFRIYDHCLSVKEVKELSKGLVGYWPLCGNYNAIPNKLLNSAVEVSNNNYNTVIYETDSPPETGKAYTITVCLTPGEGLTHITPYLSAGYKSCGAMAVNGTNKQILTHTFTAGYHTDRPPSVKDYYGYIYIYRFPNDGTVTSNTTIHWVKLEEGSKATNWIPNAAEDGDLTIENDCSGYEFNGVKAGTFTYDGDSPRNECAAIFDGSTTSIELPIKDLMGQLLSNQCTINFWAKEADVSSRSVYFGGHPNSSFNIEMLSSKLRVYWGGSPDLSISTIVNDVWAMWTIVVDKTTGILIYKDGEQVYTYNSTLGDLTCGGNFKIGRDYRNNNAGEATITEGSMSDFRIYATCLSAADVKELYRVSVSIDEDGRIYGSNFKEV